MRKAAYCLLAVLLASSGLSQDATATRSTSTFPRVVAKVAFWHKTGGFDPITVFTPKQFGIYRVSGMLVVTTFTNNEMYGHITYQDKGGGEQVSFQSSPNVGDYTIGPFLIRDHIGVPIQLEIDKSQYIGGRYNLFVVVEQIM
jgi:hypothetical protein